MQAVLLGILVVLAIVVVPSGLAEATAPPASTASSLACAPPPPGVICRVLCSNPKFPASWCQVI